MKAILLRLFAAIAVTLPLMMTSGRRTGRVGRQLHAQSNGRREWRPARAAMRSTTTTRSKARADSRRPVYAVKRRQLYGQRRFLGTESVCGRRRPASVSAGRVVGIGGEGLRNINVILTGGTLLVPRQTRTNSFGAFTFEDNRCRDRFTPSAFQNKKYGFPQTSQVFSVLDSITDIIFQACLGELVLRSIEVTWLTHQGVCSVSYFSKKN